jgi:hypothetical protein
MRHSGIVQVVQIVLEVVKFQAGLPCSCTVEGICLMGMTGFHLEWFVNFRPEEISLRGHEYGPLLVTFYSAKLLLCYVTAVPSYFSALNIVSVYSCLFSFVLCRVQPLGDPTISSFPLLLSSSCPSHSPVYLLPFCTVQYCIR